MGDSIFQGLFHIPFRSYLAFFDVRDVRLALSLLLIL